MLHSVHDRAPFLLNNPWFEHQTCPIFRTHLIKITDHFVSALASENAVPERPLFGCQVLVQSEEEKNLKKAMRKEEKRMNKLLNKADDVRI